MIDSNRTRFERAKGEEGRNSEESLNPEENPEESPEEDDAKHHQEHALE